MDRTHNPEFTMLEFYQAFADMHDMMAVTEILIADAVTTAAGSARVTYQGAALDFTPPWPRLSMVDAVGQAMGEDVSALDPAQLRRLAGAHGVETRPGLGPGGLLDALFSEKVQPGLERPTFVVDHPIETSPLARVSRTRPGVVERFELFVAGMEIANAFSEQNDPVAQREALEAQTRLRESGHEEAQGMDQDYVRALEYGMPPTGGVGIGIDRLAMLVSDARSIRDVILFPQLRPEEGREELHDDEAGGVPAEAPVEARTPGTRGVARGAGRSSA
jgi:lysyl-tRNA synthetase class 2